MHKEPSQAPFNSLFSISTIAGTTPNKGKDADPAFKSVQPGKGLIKIPPVSVCHLRIFYL